MRIFFMLAFVLAVTGSCKKETTPASSASLNGRWNYVEYYESIGGPGSWYAVSPPAQWIEIKENGGISTNIPSFNGVTGYQLQDSITIRFTTLLMPAGARSFRYNMDTLQATLIMSPVNPSCIEGCALKFKRD